MKAVIPSDITGASLAILTVNSGPAIYYKKRVDLLSRSSED